MKRFVVDVDGVGMAWLEQGAGFPVVLLHGIPTSPELWRHVMPRLRGLHVFAWEMVGYGASISEGQGRDISVAGQSEHLAAWMTKLGLKRAVLAGHDLGGGVAQITAVHRPDLCSGLFLTNAVGYDSWPIPSVSAMKGTAPLMRHLPNTLFKLLLMSLFARGHGSLAQAREAFRTHAPYYLRCSGASSLLQQVEQLHARDTIAIADRLPTLDIPCRLAWGDADQFQKFHYGERFAADLGAPLRRIRDGKHFTPEDHPIVIAEEITRLVAEVESRAPK